MPGARKGASKSAELEPSVLPILPVRPTLTVHAAGSLRNVLPVLTAAFKDGQEAEFVVRHGPAGLLRERIEAGDRPDLFLSANFGHPARLAEIGLSGPPIVFARNSIVALVRKDAGITTASFIDRLLAPDVAVATSTPVLDPSGDYAWAVFEKIDRIRPGALAVLDAKARKLVGGAEQVRTSGSYDVIAQALADRTATLFLGYRTGLGLLASQTDGVEVVEIPGEVGVVPEYSMVALEGCHPQALAFALFILSVAGQKLLAEAGFQPVALPNPA